MMDNKAVRAAVLARAAVGCCTEHGAPSTGGTASSL